MFILAVADLAIWRVQELLLEARHRKRLMDEARLPSLEGRPHREFGADPEARAKLAAQQATRGRFSA